MIYSPSQQYQQSMAQTSSPAKLLLMLYDGGIRFIRMGLSAMEIKDNGKANECLVKAQSIIRELMSTLDSKYDISKSLYSLYEYMLHQLIQANLHKKTEPAQEVLDYMIELKDAWQEAGKSMKPQASNQLQPGVQHDRTV